MDYRIFSIYIFCAVCAFGVQSFPAETNLDVSNEDYNSTVLFYLYTNSTIQNVHQLWKGANGPLKSSDFDITREKTVVLAHGFWDELDSSFNSEFIHALLKFEDVNVIAIDWSYYTKNINYLWVVQHSKGVGSFLGEFLDFIIDETSMSPDNLHLIGHSLGAHVSGFAAKFLQAKGRTVARISGLDPAWPGFFKAGPDSRLSSTDAKFVDCIHSCGGELGFPFPICHADFYPNGGKKQPGCPWFDLGVCSHGRSYDYYSESIDPSHVFESHKCSSVVDGVPYSCKNSSALMGYPATNKYQGTYYLETRSSSPFAKIVR